MLLIILLNNHPLQKCTIPFASYETAHPLTSDTFIEFTWSLSVGAYEYMLLLVSMFFAKLVTNPFLVLDALVFSFTPR